MEKIDHLIFRYSEAERVYLESNSKSTEYLRKHLVNLFTSILEFQAKVARHYSHRDTIQGLRNTFIIGDWHDLLGSIEVLSAACNDAISQLDSKDGRTRAERLNEILACGERNINIRLAELQEQNTQIIAQLTAGRMEEQLHRQSKAEADCLQVLRRTLDYEAHKDRNLDRVANTCQWF